MMKESYLAVPEHKRRSILGDMDRKDAPLRALCGLPVGLRRKPEELGLNCRWALEYFTERGRLARDARP